MYLLRKGGGDMQEKNCLISFARKIFFLLLMFCNSVYASNLCEYENVIESSGSKMFIGCNNGQLKSISIQGENWFDYWIFIGRTKEFGNGEYHFIPSESYKLNTGLKFVESADDFNNVLGLDSAFFHNRRTVFMCIHGSPRDTILQLKEPSVKLSENIKFTSPHLQKIDIFTSDSIKIPNIYINRRNQYTSIDIAIIECFRFRLINNELIIQFDEFHPEHYRYLSSEERAESNIYVKSHKYKFRLLTF